MWLTAERLYTWLNIYKKKPFIQSISTQNNMVDNMQWRIARKQTSTNKTLTQKAIEALNKFNKQKSAKTKSKVSRRKIKRRMV